MRRACVWAGFLVASLLSIAPFEARAATQDQGERDAYASERRRAVTGFVISGVGVATAVASRAVAAWAWNNCEVWNVPGWSAPGCGFRDGVMPGSSLIILPRSPTFYVGLVGILGGMAGGVLGGLHGGRSLGRARNQGTKDAELTVERARKIRRTGIALLVVGVASVATSALSLACPTEAEALQSCRYPLGITAFSIGVASVAMGFPLLAYHRQRRLARQRRLELASLSPFVPFTSGRRLSGMRGLSLSFQFH